MRRAFTLIELLVVVTIIVILVALLIPGLERAVASAQSAVCAATLRGWSQAMTQYAFDHKGSVVQMEYTRGQFWFHRMAPYLGQPSFAKTPIPPEGGVDDPLKAMLCPVVKVTEFDKVVDSGAVSMFIAYGTVDKTWAGLNTRGGYCWNAALSKYSGNAYQPHVGFYGKYTTAPGDTPLISDGVWVDTWPRSDSGARDNPPNDYSYAGDGGTSMGRVCIDRHNLAINIAYANGAAGAVPLGDLWTQNWHSNFEPYPAYQNGYFQNKD